MRPTILLFVVHVLLVVACTDQEVTEDFGDVVECDDGYGAWVDHGSRITSRVEFDAVCMPKCGYQTPASVMQVCPAGLVFYTVPVKITPKYTSGNLCYCDNELGTEGIGEADEIEWNPL